MRGNIVWAVLEKTLDKNGSTMRIVELGLSEKEAKETAKLLSHGGTEYVASAMKLGIDYGQEAYATFTCSKCGAVGDERRDNG